MHCRSSSTFSSRRAKRWAPVRRAAAFFFVLAAVWQFIIVPRLPPIHSETDTRDTSVAWVESFGAMKVIGQLGETATIVVGDSRIPAGVDILALREGGVQGAASLWSGGASLSRTLPAASTFTPRRMVVCLSLIGLTSELPGPKAEFHDGEGPPAGFAVKSPEYRSWRTRRLDELLALGFKSKRVHGLVNVFEREYERSLRRTSFGPSGIDEWLGSRFHHLRFNSFRTVRPKRWAVTWFDKFDETLSDSLYQSHADRFDASESKATRETVLNEIIQLRANGCDVICVRLPVAPSLTEIERSVISDEELREFCRDAGAPFLDYAGESYATYDGLHMSHGSEVRFSKRLAADLLNTFGE